MTAAALLLLVALAAPQEPSPRPAPVKEQEPRREQEPEQAPLSKEARARAEALLRRHAERSAKVDVLVADYTQRRFTKLSKQPLVSEGAFLFVKEPACVVFRGEKPRRSVVRLTTACYEVFRPRRKQLERFVLAGPELARGLFAAIGGDAARLLGDFEVVACDDVGEDSAQVCVRLRPTAAAVRARVAELRVTLAVETAELRSVAYRDVSAQGAAGDLVEIELRRLRPNPAEPPSAELDVPEGTRVLEHRVENG